MPIYVVIPSQESLDEEVRVIVPQEESSWLPRATLARPT